MPQRKYRKWWDGNDFIILTKKQIDQEKFFEEMRMISQKMFGVADGHAFEDFFVPIGRRRKEDESDKP